MSQKGHNTEGENGDVDNDTYNNAHNNKSVISASVWVVQEWLTIERKIGKWYHNKCESHRSSGNILYPYVT